MSARLSVANSDEPTCICQDKLLIHGERLSRSTTPAFLPRPSSVPGMSGFFPSRPAAPHSQDDFQTATPVDTGPAPLGGAGLDSQTTHRSSTFDRPCDRGRVARTGKSNVGVSIRSHRRATPLRQFQNCFRRECLGSSRRRAPKNCDLCGVASPPQPPLFRVLKLVLVKYFQYCDGFEIISFHVRGASLVPHV